MDHGRVAKFIVRVIISFALFAVGTAIFFTSEEDNLKLVGVLFISSVFGTWMKLGSSKLTTNPKN